MFEPFASVYATKMIPNNQFDADTRFRKLVEAVKFIYASTFFKDAKNYIKMTKHTTADEKMAVIIQEVVGSRYADRFYPHICGVARSYNFYPSGNAKSEDGVIDLALGLGKSIVDDSIAALWWNKSLCARRLGRDAIANRCLHRARALDIRFWRLPSEAAKPVLPYPLVSSAYTPAAG